MKLFRTRRQWQAVTSGVCLFLPCVLTAASFEIIEGKGTAVCEAYQAAVREWHSAVACFADQPLAGPDISRITAPILEIRNGNDERDPEYALMASAGD